MEQIARQLVSPNPAVANRAVTYAARHPWMMNALYRTNAFLRANATNPVAPGLSKFGGEWGGNLGVPAMQ